MQECSRVLPGSKSLASPKPATLAQNPRETIYLKRIFFTHKKSQEGQSEEN
jgi:hypothetical protein